jgi:biotin synthase
MMKRPGKLSFTEALTAGTTGSPPEAAWLLPLLTCDETDAPRLHAAADAVRRAHVGDAVHLRGLIEFSNRCRLDCAYCGLRRSNTGVERYRMTHAQVLDTARRAEDLGFRSIVLQSGEDLWYTAERLAAILRDIKAATDLAITLSAGERDRETYRAWREAGADRYLLRIETTDPALFAALHPDDDLEARKACLVALRELDYQLGSGIMVGLPGQAVESIAADLLWLHGLGAEMVGIGPFIPNPETPLSAADGGTVPMTLRVVAVLRLVLPDAHIPATTAMGSLDPLGREKALQAGANVVMPNVTPVEFRENYQLYPGKICLSDDAAHCRGCLEGRIASIGRHIATDHGHTIRG